MSLHDLIEFAWGLANSDHYFLWIIRSDFVVGESTALPPELEKLLGKKRLYCKLVFTEKGPKPPIHWRVLDSWWLGFNH